MDMSALDRAVAAVLERHRTRQAIVDFVDARDDRGRRDYVPPQERVAIFDNDGTLWTEKPMPIQLDFILRRLAEMAEQDQALREHQPWKAAYEQGLRLAWRGDDQALPRRRQRPAAADGRPCRRRSRADGRRVHRPAADGSCASARTRPSAAPSPPAATSRWSSCCATWRPTASRNYIASGGDRDFMRPIAWELYGIPPRAGHRQLPGIDFQERDDGSRRRSTRPRWSSSTTARTSRSASGAGSAGGRSWPAATPTATCRCCASPAPRPAGPAPAGAARRRRARVRLHRRGGEGAGAGRDAGLDRHQPQERLGDRIRGRVSAMTGDTTGVTARAGSGHLRAGV